MENQKKLYCIFLLLAIAEIITCSRTQEASFICEKRDNEMIAKFRLLRNNDTIYQIIGYTAAEADPEQSTALTSCASVGQYDIYELNITINIITDSSTPNCGIYTVTSKNIYRIRVRSQETPGVKSANDAYYDFICDVSKTLRSWMTLQSYAQGTLTSVNLQPFYSGLSLWAMDYNTNVPLSGEIELGREIYYQIAFQPCFPTDTKFDTCGHEFEVAFHSFNDPTGSTLTLYLINPSSNSISVQIESASSTELCSPLVVAPKSFGTCFINTSFEISTTSYKAIRVLSPFQCIYVQRQHYTSQYFSVIPILPSDIIGQSYFMVSPLHDTEVVVVATNQSSINIAPVSQNNVSSEITNFETFYYQFSSGTDKTGSSFTSSDKTAVFKKTTFKNGSGTISGITFEQLMPDSAAGKRFVIPNIFNSWKCLVLKDTISVRYGATVSTGNKGSIITSSVTSSMEITSTKPIICLAEITLLSSLVMTPYEQWSNSYTFVLNPDHASHTLIIVIEAVGTNSLMFLVNNKVMTISGTWTGVTQTTGSTLNMVSLEMPIQLSGLTSAVLSHPVKVFQALLKSTHTTSNSVSVALLPGFLAVQSNKDSCTGSLGHYGDLIDNNCDGLFDEQSEPISGNNYADFRGIKQDKICIDRARVADCEVSPDSKFENIVKQKIIENGCVTGAGTDPFRPVSNFAYDSQNSDNLTQIYKSGKTKLVGFDGFNNVYLRCTVQFCFLYDRSCETICKQRRKRDTVGDNTNPVTLITLSDLKQEKTNRESCFDSPTFISVITSLSVVLAGLLAVIIYGFVRIYQMTSARRTEMHVSMTSFDSKIN